jgi:hypothetical protein
MIRATREGIGHAKDRRDAGYMMKFEIIFRKEKLPASLATG